MKQSSSHQKTARASSKRSSRAARRPDNSGFISRLRHKTSVSNHRPGRHKLILLGEVLSIGLVILMLGGVLMLRSSRQDLSAAQNLYGKNMAGSVRYYDRTGRHLLWTDYSSTNRSVIPASQIPASIRSATIATEDKNFYHEGAINIGSIARALAHDALHPHDGIQGGSTITEQLVKLNEGWLGNASISRKIKEIFLASGLSKKYSKDEILAAYLNTVPYGGEDYGVEAAAEDYFHEPASQLTLPQAAMLAAIPQSPSYYSPRSPSFNAQMLQDRQNYILGLMEQQGYVSKAEAVSAKSVNVLAQVQPPQGRYASMTAPYFDLLAKQQLERLFGAGATKSSGLKVITTLDFYQQQEAEKLVAKNLPNVIADRGDNEAVVTEHVPTGQVTSLVGGTDFYNPIYGQINYASAPINPGSSYKLYDYISLLNATNNVGAGSVLFDSKQPLPGYPCTNQQIPGGNCLYDYDFQYPGPLTLRYALAGSRNVPAVKAMLIAGEEKTIQLSEAMGLKSGYKCYDDVAKTRTTPCQESAAIGYGYLSLDQHVNGFATSARLGQYLPQTFILKIIGPTGNTVYKWRQPTPQQVVKPDAAYIVNNMLSDPGASYLPGSCNNTNCTPISTFGFKFHRTNGWNVAIKTGTTENTNSGLMMAMTTQYAVGSWVGYHTADRQLIPHYGGLEGVTEPLTRGMIEYVTQNKAPVNWAEPNDMKVLPAFVVNNPPVGRQGHYYGWKYPSQNTDLFPSWYSPAPVSASAACNANSFSVDPYVDGRTIQAQSYGKKPFCSTNPGAPGSLTISINQVVCDTPYRCMVTVTATQGTASQSGGAFNSTPSGTITIMANGRMLATIGLPPGTGSYTTSIILNNVSRFDVLTAQLTDGSNHSAVSRPVAL